MNVNTSANNIRLVKQGGKAVLRAEYPDGISQTDLISTIKTLERMIRNYAPRSALVLSVFGDYKQIVSDDIINTFRDSLKGNREFVKKSAVVGISGMRKIFFNSLLIMTKRKLRLFENEIQAMEYLTKED